MPSLWAVAAVLLVAVCCTASAFPTVSLDEVPPVPESLLQQLLPTLSEGPTAGNVALTSFFCENVTAAYPKFAHDPARVRNAAWLAASPTSRVDVYIGTGGDGYGSVNYPTGVQVPFGCMRVGPDTALDYLRIPWREGGGASRRRILLRHSYHRFLTHSYGTLCCAVPCVVPYTALLCA
jgi:hypothetical protein